jgi:ATP-dependent exoDNAse (exonuclease V) beta subunit
VSAESPGPVTLIDAEARRRIREDLDTTLVVEAAAGTGKTSELVRRIVSVLASGRTRLERMVAVTFTEKAAGEMKLRLRAEIESARRRAAGGDRTRAALEQALAELEAARIGTIHGFCADLLRERPIEARVDPSFRVLDEEASRELLAGAFDRWFERTLADPPEGVRRILRRRAARHEADARARLFDACRALVEHRDFDTPWSRPPFERDARIDALLAEMDPLAALADSARNPRDTLAKNFRALQRFVRDATRHEGFRARDYDALEQQLATLAKNRDVYWKHKGSGAWYADQIRRAELLSRRDALKAALDAFVADANADLAACLQRDLRPVVALYEEVKAKAGALDFLDLLVQTRNLVQRDAGVRRELQGRLTHVFVDEFQDTDPLQAEILLLLAADDAETADPWRVRPVPGKLFVVGDPKQAIYRFRRADVAFYERVKQQLLASGAELLNLSASFRSLPAIQAAVNASFAPLMQGAEDGSQARYVALDPFRADRSDQPAVVALPIPDPYGWTGVSKYAVEASFPDAVAGFVDWLVHHSGWTVCEGDPSQLVPVAPRHVCLLLRRFQSYGKDLTHPYVRALEARRIGHVLVGGRSFHEREEVTALRTALHAIEWPDDELSVYATLRGAFFGFNDETLFAFRAAHGRLEPTRPASGGSETHEVSDALELLRRLHAGRNRRPIASTIEELLATTRAHAALAIWPTGEQALANVMRLADAARRFEARGATSFRAFIDFVDEQAARGEGQEAPVIEEGADGVRLLTVHRAKGLEFPVVVLCDPTALLKSSEPTRYVDARRGLWAFRLAGCAPRELHDHRDDALRHEDAESIRLGYVAATRARDLLVVPVLGDGPDPKWREGWVSVLEPAVYPERDAWQRARAAPGCPRFGGDSVRRRASDGAHDGSGVAPGRHTTGCGCEVTWWDPNVLNLDVEAIGGLRQMELLIDTGLDGASSEGMRNHQAWAERHQTTLDAGKQRSVVARTVTALAQDAPTALPPGVKLSVERTAAPRASRPRGARFGTLVHAVLAETAFDAPQGEVQALAEAVGRLIGAPDPEIQAAADAVSAALAHPLLRQAAEAALRGDCRRETPLAERSADGSIVEGVVDLAFRAADGAWIVVDFKTDAKLTLEGPYAAQLAAYVRTIQALGESVASAVVLSV